MHDIDRTLSELDPEAGFDASDADFEGDFEAAFDDGEELEDEEAELELEASGLPFSEDEELELAAELLAVEDDEELDLFLGKVFRRVRRRFRGVGKRLKRIARPLGRVLRPVARRLLPIAGRAVGTFFGGPVGGAIGSRAAAFAGRAFGLELEGLAPEEQELEIARRFVRLAGGAAMNAARVPSDVPPDRAARMAVGAAARRFAPGLAAGGRRSGRWIRRGGRIILLGV